LRNAGKRAAEREVFDGARGSFLGYFFGQAKKYLYSSLMGCGITPEEVLLDFFRGW